MFFASDNSGPVHPQILDALRRANDGHMMGYGRPDDSVTQAAVARLRDVFEAPQAEIWLVGTGTAANVLALSAMVTPFQTVYCSPVAHIHEDEFNGFEFHSGGAKLALVGDSDKMAPDALAAAIDHDIRRGQSPEQMGPVSLTQATERGRVYTCPEIAALCDVAKRHDLPVHMDGARFANAVATLGCTPAEMTWKAGISALSFGGTKNGCMGVEAVIFFDPGAAPDFALRRRRAGHTFSKHRYLAAQMLAYLEDDLWLATARKANENRARLEVGLRQARGIRIDHAPQANMIFARLPEPVHQRLQGAGAVYYSAPPDADGLRPVRLVCDWSLDPDDIDSFLGIAANS